MQLKTEKTIVQELQSALMLKDSLIQSLQQEYDDIRVNFQQCKRIHAINTTKLTTRVQEMEGREIELMQANSDLLQKTIACEDALMTRFARLKP